MDSLGLIQKISIFILPVLFAITVHEAAHAYAARYFGDNTAYHEGRMTLNSSETHRPCWHDFIAAL